MAELAISSSSVTSANASTATEIRRPQQPLTQQRDAPVDSGDQVSLSREALALFEQQALSEQETLSGQGALVQQTLNPATRSDNTQTSTENTENGDSNDTQAANRPNLAREFESLAKDPPENNVDILA